MLKQTGNVITFNRSMKLKNKQLLKIKGLDDSTKMKYLMSLMGIEVDLDYDQKYKLKEYKAGQLDDKLAKKRNDHVLYIQRQTLNNSADMNHKPLVNTAKNRWVGVEIECYIPDLVDEECDYCHGHETVTCSNCDGDGYLYVEDHNGNEYRVDCHECDGDGERECPECDGSSSGLEVVRNKLREAGIGKISVRRDGSVDADEGGLEVCMLFDANQGFDKLERLLIMLNAMGATVDGSCGLHVHLNQYDTDLVQASRLGKKMEKFLPVVSKFVPESRRENQYCKLQSSTRERYSAINLTAFKKHGTIEYRLHTGSTNFEKIKNWIELLIHLEDYCKNNNMTRKFKSLNYFFQRTKLPKHLVEYYTMRFNKFNKTDDDTETEGIDDTTITLDAGVYEVTDMCEESRTITIDPAA